MGVVDTREVFGSGYSVHKTLIRFGVILLGAENQIGQAEDDRIRWSGNCHCTLLFVSGKSHPKVHRVIIARSPLALPITSACLIC